MQLGGPPTQRHMGNPPDDAVSRPSFSTVPATKLILVYHPTFQRGLLGSDVLADNRHSGITEHAKASKSGREKVGWAMSRSFFRCVVSALPSSEDLDTFYAFNTP